MTTTLPAIAIIGTGSMGGAILGGLLAPGVTVDGGIRVTNRTAAKAAQLTLDGVTSLSTEADPDANRHAVAGAAVVIVAVKPAMVLAALEEFGDAVEAGAIVISVAAGVTIAAMERVIDRPILRAMPNTPALIGLGVTGLSAGSRVSSEQEDVASAVFETVGSVLRVPEERIDALSTISGSGPAYVFFLIEQLTRTAIALGFSERESRVMVEETFRGAAELLKMSADAPAELRRRVTSPNGTTERAIGVLQEADLSGLFDRATAAALARSRELAG